MCYVSTHFATFTSQWILGIIATGDDMIMNYYQEPAVSCVAISRKISKTANNAYSHYPWVMRKLIKRLVFPKVFT